RGGTRGCRRTAPRRRRTDGRSDKGHADQKARDRHDLGVRRFAGGGGEHARPPGAGGGSPRGRRERDPRLARRPPRRTALGNGRTPRPQHHPTARQPPAGWVAGLRAAGRPGSWLKAAGPSPRERERPYQGETGPGTPTGGDGEEVAAAAAESGSTGEGTA